MKDELTTVEILGLAIRSEEDAAKFYAGLARKVKNDLVKTKYVSLAREESAHRQLLLNLYRKMTGEEKAPEIPGSPETAEGGEMPEGVDDFEGLLKIAIERERKAYLFYKDRAGGVTDVNGRRLFEYLASIERGHEAMLASELEAYLKDKNWYAENPDIQLV